MKRIMLPFAWVALSVLLAASPANAQSCSIGGHNETSENFTSPAGWTTTLMSPGSVLGPPSASHVVISEVAPRGGGAGAGSDSSEYIEIYNPTTRSVRFDDKYISDDIGYPRVVNGPYLAVNTSDWTLRFPPGTSLSPGRTIVLCVTKAGYFGSGMPVPAATAQYFLEMKDSNGNPADDMIIKTTNSAFPVTGGNLTNPSTTNGEWVVLFCWNGTSDLVCDIDYASWGANSASNPKMDKSGLTIDGPDAGAVASAYNPDTPAASQTNLGTALTKPNTFQRVGGEIGEITVGGNGCKARVLPTVIDWVPVAGTSNIRFHMRWTNDDDDNTSDAISGSMMSQDFGVFMQDFGHIGDFNVPALQPLSFFDVFLELPLDALPPAPQKMTPGEAPNGPAVAAMLRGARSTTTVPCPPDTNWAGNVDIFWSGPGQTGQVNKHYADLLTCPGGAPSYIHFRPSNCTSPMPWSVAGLCPGFSATLVNEDLSPAPNPVPVGWSGWIQVNAAAVVPSGTTCCFSVLFTCNGSTSTIDICSTACDCQPHKPTLTQIDWTKLGAVVRFHQRWENLNLTGPTGPVSGDMTSQPFGVFLPTFGPIGHFDVPPIAVNSFFDVFFDVPLNQLPAEPQIVGGPAAGSPQCFPDQWHGNVNVDWTGPGGSGSIGKHFGEIPLCAGRPTCLHVETNCTSALGASWSIAGLCPGFSATLLNLDHTPAPNPVPPGWIGFICVTAAPGTPVGTLCCFQVTFVCDGVAAKIDVCAKTCVCPRKPVLKSTDWTRVGSNIRFHMQWMNPDVGGASDPVHGTMNSQPFGAFAQDFGPIGEFNVPAISVNSFFDVFIEVPLDQLPPEPPKQLPGGGPPPGSPCPPDTSWSGNVDIQWSGMGGTGQVNRHFTNLLVRPGSGSSHIHALIFCNDAAGATWSITGLCPGWSATLLNEDFTPAPNPVPAGWTGWISVAAAASVPSGSSCCFSITFLCAGVPGVIEVCAEACLWPTTDVPPNTRGVDFGIYTTTPNPTSSGMLIGYAMPKSGLARLEIYDLGGKRVRTLLDGHVEAGMSAVRWDGRGENGRSLAPGAYFVTFRSGERVSNKRIVLFH